MPLSTKLDRKLRPEEESSDGEDYYEVTDRSSSESFIETGEGGDVISSGDEAGDASENDMVCLVTPKYKPNANTEKSDASDDRQVQAQISKVSFGALAKAQDELSKEQLASRKRKRGDETSQSQEDKLEALRERLRQIKAAKLANGAPPSKKEKGAAKKKKTPAQDSEVDESADSDNSDSDAAPRARSSKHAPAVQSSKKMVSRKRQVVDVKKPVFRDPRFDNISGPRPDEHALGRRYAFLNDYKASEIADLKSTIRKTKNEDDKERLKKQLMSMESQEHTRKRKEEQQNVVRDHKKREKELVKEGKQPFYLKKCTFLFDWWLRFGLCMLTFPSSRAKEDCSRGPVPEHEGKAARQGHRAPSQEGHGKRTKEYARRPTHCLNVSAWGGVSTSLMSYTIIIAQIPTAGGHRASLRNYCIYHLCPASVFRLIWIPASSLV